MAHVGGRSGAVTAESADFRGQRGREDERLSTGRCGSGAHPAPPEARAPAAPWVALAPGGASNPRNTFALFHPPPVSVSRRSERAKKGQYSFFTADSRKKTRREASSSLW